ncbi:MAG: hypothetical protein CM15mP79_1550 [Methanobacteriota archaeon]|nr:MAG: hypothetical protein CM15mP79_1550 [Euryarchaeota archaeon]
MPLLRRTGQDVIFMQVTHVHGMAAPRLLAVALVTLLLVPLAGCFAPVEGVAIEGHQGQVLPRRPNPDHAHDGTRAAR